ncbi:type I-MYXAN CRISPR-associated protein Cas6/Cmx6 [Nitrospira moscoviensis]|uniref:CRISPR-associated protein, Cas6-related n=1 Tax=Nitrospira moscoviensis TaxID=42253 RepID=A0A0K2GAP6_NITMO|nr:type I-MYXAN CRISPR-associated protein Cas6/Cmx6 [Nitrospira moscoviensis]ALA57929.1 CRISPR-associated protein, Cas6-related [Nitrospira moscoviensis]
MPMIDLAFRLMGMRIPVDHGYAVYAAINRVVPELHDAKDIGVHPVRGRFDGDGCLLLSPASRLIIRTPDDRIREFLKLAGKTLEVDGHRFRLGVPELRALRSAVALVARLVTIKGFMEAGEFIEAAQRQLEAMSVTAALQLGERRTLRIKDKQVVGFEVLASELDVEGSIKLQEAGIGGRRRMGCGVFVPFQRTVQQ